MVILDVTWDSNNKGSNITLTDNFTAKSKSSVGGVRATEGKDKGKWYCEFSSEKAGYFTIGISDSTSDMKTISYNSTTVRAYTPSYKIKIPERTSYGSTVKSNDVYSILLDVDNGTLEFWVNGVSQGVSHNDLSKLTKPLYITQMNSEGWGEENSFGTINFGAKPFVYDIPKGYTAYNLDFKTNFAIKNPTTNQHYSLAEKTLIHLPDTSDKNMILHGMEQGTEIQLDVDFDKMKFVQDKSEVLGDGKVFSHEIGVSKHNILKLKNKEIQN